MAVRHLKPAGVRSINTVLRGPNRPRHFIPERKKQLMQHPAAKAIVPAVLAAITLLVAFGVPLTEGQQQALTGFVLALVPVVVYFVPNRPRR